MVSDPRGIQKELSCHASGTTLLCTLYLDVKSPALWSISKSFKISACLKRGRPIGISSATVQYGDTVGSSCVIRKRSVKNHAIEQNLFLHWRRSWIRPSDMIVSRFVCASVLAYLKLAHYGLFETTRLSSALFRGIKVLCDVRVNIGSAGPPVATIGRVKQSVDAVTSVVDTNCLLTESSLSSGGPRTMARADVRVGGGGINDSDGVAGKSIVDHTTV